MSDPAIVAAVAAIVGSVAGLLSALAATHVRGREVDVGSEAALRKDMAEQIHRLHVQIGSQGKRIDDLEAETIGWRDRYYKEHEERIATDALNAELCVKNDELTTKCAEMAQRIKQLEDHVAILLRRQ